MSSMGTTDQNAEYRAPITGPDTGRPDWVPANPVTNAIFGKSYVDEANPSWEEVITMVVIPGNPASIYNAAGHWEVLFSRIEEAKWMVDQEIRRLQSWEGAAGDTYRTHLGQISQKMAELVQKHQPVVQELRTSANNLQNALENCPIPDDMVDEVMQARQSYQNGGSLNVSQFGPGYIFNRLFPVFSNRWISEAVNFITGGFADWVSDKLRDWITDEDDKAKAAYRQLAGEHVSTMDSMPTAQRLMNADAYARTVTPGMPEGPLDPSLAGDPSGYGTNLAGAGGGPGGPGAGGAGGIPGMGGGGMPPGAGGLPPGGGLAGGGPGTFPAGGPAGPGGGMGAGGPVAMPGSTSAASAGRGMGSMGMGGMGGGMAGAGAAGAGGGAKTGRPSLNVPSSSTASAGGAGGRAGGMGMGGMGMGAGGAAAAGAGRGGAGAAGRAAGAAGMGGMAGGAAAGGRAGGAGGRAGGVPMGGAGAGAGGGGESDHSTWLNEDEDVWGTESDAPPPVLGG